ncbi:BA14K family protein [uncultured Cohaesibacter sp.]|uniref:BA14K family protein n=1 Tax=uncultured Cohaesibacter sp. TaxID=1002546 RepID=UPI0029C76358|nr:BA14K family protein [uncultured Cohaesibacter sp.]
MTTRKLYIYALLMAILPAIAITIPTSDAHAANGRKGAFVAGLVAGAVGAAVLYSASQNRWHKPRNHYHRGNWQGCHTHNGVRHCHGNYRPRRPAPVHYGRPAPWSPAWYDYCHSRYRSFNPRTGYFTTYSGHKQFCR